MAEKGHGWANVKVTTNWEYNKIEKKYWQNYPIRNILLLSKGKGNKKSYRKKLKNMHTILDNWIYYSIDS